MDYLSKLLMTVSELQLNAAYHANRQDDRYLDGLNDAYKTVMNEIRKVMKGQDNVQSYTTED